MEAEQARILIVDDDRELRELIAETLSEYGYYSQAAKNGAELFAALEREPFDLILLDIMMPGEDGLSLCRRLRAPGRGGVRPAGRERELSRSGRLVRPGGLSAKLAGTARHDARSAGGYARCCAARRSPERRAG